MELLQQNLLRDKIHLFMQSKLIHHPQKLLFLAICKIKAPLISQSTLLGQ